MYCKTSRIRNVRKMDRLHCKLVRFVIVRHFYSLRQTHYITTDNAYHESDMFYSTGLFRNFYRTAPRYELGTVVR